MNPDPGRRNISASAVYFLKNMSEKYLIEERISTIT